MVPNQCYLPEKYNIIEISGHAWSSMEWGGLPKKEWRCCWRTHTPYWLHSVFLHCACDYFRLWFRSCLCLSRLRRLLPNHRKLSSLCKSGRIQHRRLQLTHTSLTTLVGGSKRTMKLVCFQQMHNQGLGQLVLTVPLDLCANAANLCPRSSKQRTRRFDNPCRALCQLKKAETEPKGIAGRNRREQCCPDVGSLICPPGKQGRVY